MTTDAISQLEEKHHTKFRGWNDLPLGWFPLVDALLTDLSKLPTWNISQVSQIKEKFGGLRVYIDYLETNTDADIAQMDELISKAETRSLELCQSCGAAGTRKNKGNWVVTMCDMC